MVPPRRTAACRCTPTTPAAKERTSSATRSLGSGPSVRGEHDWRAASRPCWSSSACVPSPAFLATSRTRTPPFRRLLPGERNAGRWRAARSTHVLYRPRALVAGRRRRPPATGLGLTGPHLGPRGAAPRVAKRALLHRPPQNAEPAMCVHRDGVHGCRPLHRHVPPGRSWPDHVRRLHHPSPSVAPTPRAARIAKNTGPAAIDDELRTTAMPGAARAYRLRQPCADGNRPSCR